jgi:hypothetical protein
MSVKIDSMTIIEHKTMVIITDKKILIVEDEAIVALELEYRLKAMGTVFCGKVPSGEKAIYWLRKPIRI